MKLSAPVYHLKRKARLMARTDAIPLHDALDRIASSEGYSGWSLLAACHAKASVAAKLSGLIAEGDLVLVGARPGHGKTLLALQLAVEAMKSGNPGVFFTLEYTQRDILERFRALGVDIQQFGGLFTYDCSDAICAEHIMAALKSAPRGTLVVVDYLQLLDQRRENAPVGEQVRALKAFARERGLVIVFISQIDREFDSATKRHPEMQDVRLPNPLDLSLFDKTCFLNRGEVHMQARN